MRGTASGQHEREATFSSSVEAGAERPGGVSCSEEKVRTCSNASLLQACACGVSETLWRRRGDDMSRSTASDYTWITVSSSCVSRRPDRRVSYPLLHSPPSGRSPARHVVIWTGLPRMRAGAAAAGDRTGGPTLTSRALGVP